MNVSEEEVNGSYPWPVLHVQKVNITKRSKQFPEGREQKTHFPNKGTIFLASAKYPLGTKMLLNSSQWILIAQDRKEPVVKFRSVIFWDIYVSIVFKLTIVVSNYKDVWSENARFDGTITLQAAAVKLSGSWSACEFSGIPKASVHASCLP